MYSAQFEALAKLEGELGASCVESVGGGDDDNGTDHSSLSLVTSPSMSPSCSEVSPEQASSRQSTSPAASRSNSDAAVTAGDGTLQAPAIASQSTIPEQQADTNEVPAGGRAGTCVTHASRGPGTHSSANRTAELRARAGGQPKVAAAAGAAAVPADDGEYELPGPSRWRRVRAQRLTLGAFNFSFISLRNGARKVLFSVGRVAGDQSTELQLKCTRTRRAATARAHTRLRVSLR